MRKLLIVMIVLNTAVITGCGSGSGISVSGVLLKDGQKYTPPEGRKLALYFYPITDGPQGKSMGDAEMARYDEADGSFSVPGREGSGIPPGKYRIAVVETMRREALDQANQKKTSKRGEQKIDKETNFLDGTFGETSSPFVYDLETSTNLELDLAKAANGEPIESPRTRTEAVSPKDSPRGR